MPIKGARQLNARLSAIGNTQAFMTKLGNRTVYHAKKGVARKTGNTGRTIKRDRASARSVKVTAGGASVYLERGTKPHIIRARRARALRFATSSSGQRLSGSPRRGAGIAFARSVRHLGTQAQPFMVPAAKKAATEGGVTIVETWNGAA